MKTISRFFAIVFAALLGLPSVAIAQDQQQGAQGLKRTATGAVGLSAARLSFAAISPTPVTTAPAAPDTGPLLPTETYTVSWQELSTQPASTGLTVNFSFKVNVESVGRDQARGTLIRTSGVACSNGQRPIPMSGPRTADGTVVLETSDSNSGGGEKIGCKFRVEFVPLENGQFAVRLGPRRRLVTLTRQ